MYWTTDSALWWRKVGLYNGFTLWRQIWSWWASVRLQKPQKRPIYILGSFSTCKTNSTLPSPFLSYPPSLFLFALPQKLLFADFVKFGWPEVGEIVRCLPDKKISAPSLTLASVPIAPKISQGQRQTMYSECPKFHPNRFTSDGVIAERVNTVPTRHKVFPILGEATASSLCNNVERNIKNILYILDKAVVTITVLLHAGKLWTWIQYCK